MKKKIILLAMTAVMAVSGFAACGKKPVQESTKAAEDNGSSESEKSESEKLVAQENDIIMSHEELWNKLFGMMDKDDSAEKLDNGKKYVEILSEAFEKLKPSLTEDEVKTLTEDIGKIEEVEKKLDEIQKNEAES